MCVRVAMEACADDAGAFAVATEVCQWRRRRALMVRALVRVSTEACIRSVGWNDLGQWG
jgi:hypothetical protein